MKTWMLAGLAWAWVVLLAGCDDSSGGSAAAGALDQTRWQLAACSRAEPSPGFTAYTMLPISVCSGSICS